MYLAGEKFKLFHDTAQFYYDYLSQLFSFYVGVNAHGENEISVKSMADLYVQKG